MRQAPTYAGLVASETLAAPGGLLRPHEYGQAIRLYREPPSAELTDVVELYWSVAWTLPDGERRTQETLPYPSVHLVVEDAGAFVYGVPRAKFVRELAGHGSVLGIKFQPGGFHPLLGSSVSALRGRVLPAAEVLAADTRSLVSAVRAAPDAAGMAAAAQAWLGEQEPAADDAVRAATQAVMTVAANPQIVRVDDLARQVGTSTRSLQRLFTEYVGVGLKWVVRRFRMHEAAAQAARGTVDWAALALQLGYYDQAHFVRDFTATVGMPPTRYAAEAAPPPPGK